MLDSSCIEEQGFAIKRQAKALAFRWFALRHLHKNGMASCHLLEKNSLPHD